MIAGACGKAKPPCSSNAPPSNWCRSPRINLHTSSCRLQGRGRVVKARDGSHRELRCHQALSEHHRMHLKAAEAGQGRPRDCCLPTKNLRAIVAGFAVLKVCRKCRV